VTIGGAREAGLLGNTLIRGTLRDIDSKNDFLSSGTPVLEPAGLTVRIRCLER